MLAEIFIFAVAPLLACWIGSRGGSKRLGLLSGTTMGAGVLLSVLISASERDHHWAFEGAMPVVLLMLLTGALLGTTSAATAQYLPGVCRRAAAALARRFPNLGES